MFRDNIIYITDEGLETRHSLIRHEEPMGLVIMLPGGNNISDRPIMHFTRKGLVDLGYDVLNIDYSGCLANCGDFEAFVMNLTNFVDNVLNANLQSLNYKQIHLFGRSTGSIVGARISSTNKYDFKNVVFISPAGITFRAINKDMNYRVYYDPNDIHLNTIPFEEILELKNVDRREYLGANHNFEYDNDLQKTIRVTGEVVHDIIEYLTKE